MDVPDSSDYWEDVREQLAAEGVPHNAVFAIRHAPRAWVGRATVCLVWGRRASRLPCFCSSWLLGAGEPVQALLTCPALPCLRHPLPCSAVSGRGVTDLVRAVRALLDTLPAEDELAAAEQEGRGQQTAAAAPLPGRRDTDAKIGEFTIESDLSGPRVWFVKVRAGGERLPGVGGAWDAYVEGCMDWFTARRLAGWCLRRPASSPPWSEAHSLPGPSAAPAIPTPRAPPSSGLLR